MTRHLTTAELDAAYASLLEAAQVADRKQFEAQIELGAILVQLQALRETHPDLKARTFEEIVARDFEIHISRGYQFIQFYRIDEALRAAGEKSLTRESQARVVAPLLGSPEQLVEIVREARRMAKSEGKPLAARHLKEARLLSAPESETCDRSGGDLDDGGLGQGHLQESLVTYEDALLRDATSESAADRWPWSEAARDRFGRVPKRDRPDVLESLMWASLSEEVTPEMVDEAAGVVRAERDSRKGRPGWPVVIGVAEAVVEHNRQHLLRDDQLELLDAGLPHKPIADLDYIVPVDADGYVPEQGAPRPPLLVVIPTSLCPDTLFDAHPSARQKAEGRAEVIVEINELDHFGGPFLDVLDEHGHRMLDIRSIREASKAAGIRKVLHEAGPGIEWAMWAVNCCTGCSHGCARKFCYASDFGLLYFPQKFVPTIWPARLDAFANSVSPDPSRLPGHLAVWSRTVFHGSMTDLMNTAFPAYWIRAVINAIAESPKWTVVVLTKLAPRLTDFVWPANAVVGVTVTRPQDVRAAAKALGALKGEAQKWISAEPLFEGFAPASLIEAGVRFFAVGAQTATRWAGEVQPSARDVTALWYTVVSAGACFFPKSNLDHRGHIPFGDSDPYGGWRPAAQSAGTQPVPAKTSSRKPVKPRGPRQAASA